MGRKPIDKAIHALRGTQQRITAQVDSVAEVGRPTMPQDLPPAGQQEWRRLVKELLKRGTVTKGDRSVLELHCRTYAHYKDCEEEMRKYGRFVDSVRLDSNGEAHTVRVENPASKVALKLLAQMRQFLVQLCCTPAAREKAKQAQQPPPPAPPDENNDPRLLEEL